MNTVCCTANLSAFLRISIYKQRSIPTIVNTITCKAPIFSNNNARKYSSQEAAAFKAQPGIFQSISESAPVEYLQNFLVYVHEQSGLPWWATIVTTTILFRSSITVPFAIYQQNILAKVENITAEMPAIAKELQKETAMAVQMYKWDAKMASYQYKRSLKKQWNKLVVRDNCHPFKASILLWFQIPLWISYSMSLRNLIYLLPKGDLDAHLIFTELSIGGFGWIPNLTEVDSSYILPVALGLINLVNIELQSLSRTKTQGKIQKYLTYFIRGVSVVMVPIAASVPSCLALYWTTSSAYGLLQSIILMSPKVKRFCQIPHTASELQNPYDHVISNFKNKYLSNLKLKK